MTISLEEAELKLIQGRDHFKMLIELPRDRMLLEGKLETEGDP